jgi:hypothetical protein
MKRTVAMILSVLPLLWCTGSHASGVSVESGIQQEFWEDAIIGKPGSSPPGSSGRGKRDDRPADRAVLSTYQDGDRSLTNTLDTKINFSYVVQGKLPVDLLFGMDVNLPTGKTDLSSADLLALVRDSEIVTVTMFGEGVNLNPTLSLAKEWGPWSARVSAITSPRHFATGWTTTIPGTSLHECTGVGVFPWARQAVFGKFSRFGKDRAPSTDLFREGDYRMAGVGLSRSGAAWEADVNLRGAFRGKTENLSGGTLVTEPERSRGDEWSAEASVRHALRKDLSLSGSVRGLIISKNGYSEGASRHNGSREKIALSVGCDRRFANGMAAGVSLKGFLMTEEAQTVPQFIENRTSRGIALAFRIGLN